MGAGGTAWIQIEQLTGWSPKKKEGCPSITSSTCRHIRSVSKGTQKTRCSHNFECPKSVSKRGFVNRKDNRVNTKTRRCYHNFQCPKDVSIWEFVHRKVGRMNTKKDALIISNVQKVYRYDECLWIEKEGLWNKMRVCEHKKKILIISNVQKCIDMRVCESRIEEDRVKWLVEC